jgi:hypothetical protein
MKKREQDFEKFLLEIESDLKISFKHFDMNKSEDLLVLSSIKDEALLFDKLNHILSDNLLSNLEKQKSLEALSHTSQNYKPALDYHLPSNLKNLVTKIDAFVFDSGRLESIDIFDFLPSNIIQSFNKGLKVKKSNRSKKKEEIIRLLKTILVSFKILKQSFGLFIVYTTVSVLRNKNSSKLSVSPTPTKTLVFDFDSESTGDSGVVETSIVRSHLTTVLGEGLIDLFKSFKIMAERKLVDSVWDNLTVTEKKNIPRALQFSLTPQEYGYYKNLHFSENKLKPMMAHEIGVMCVLFLEALELITDNKKYNTVISGNKKIKTIGMVEINRSFEKSLFSIPSNPKSLPLVCRPNNWEITDESSGNIHLGGFLYNKELNFPGIINQSRNGTSSMTVDELASINYLQSNRYIINKSFFNCLKKNSKAFLLHYLKKDNFKSDMFFIDNGKLHLNTMAYYVNNNKEFVELKAKYQKSKSTASKNRFLKKSGDLQSDYKDTVNLLMQFINLYVICQVYQDVPFYFTVLLDSRGRMYYTGSGGGFGLQSGELSKSLIELVGNDFHKPTSSTFPLKPVKKSTSAYKKYVSSLKDTDYYSKWKLTCSETPRALGLDASCSGTSIISGVIGYELGMELTNIIVSTKNLNRPKQCIYTYFAEQLKLSAPKTVCEIIPEEHLKKKLKELKIDRKEFAAAAEKFYSLILVNLFERSHVKNFVMCQNYSQTSSGRGIYIYDTILFPQLVMGGEIIVFKDLKIARSICYFVAHFVGNCYHSVFPEINEFCEFLLRSVNHNKKVVLTSYPSCAKFTYEQLEYEKKTLKRPDFSGGREKELTCYIPTGDIDKKKAKRALLANYIHYLDSRLSSRVISKCRREKIPIWVNHDCFYTSTDDFPKLLKFYFESYIELLVVPDLITLFLAANDVELSDKDDKKYVELLAKKRELVFYKIKSERYAMSPHILS